MNPCYAGVGSRQTPEPVLSLISQVAAELGRRGFCLRTGGGLGADSAFEYGARSAMPPGLTLELVHVFLPWPGFQNRRDGRLNGPTREALEIARIHHPAWQRCYRTDRNLLGRTSHILLGESCRNPVLFLVCWTPDARVVGGTGQALRIARAHDIPVWNLGDPDTLALTEDWLRSDGGAVPFAAEMAK